ncbi:MAG: AbrB/MazE/SpoVT family DNA-binding domain-containing protein [Xanthobacteraceae bacterium]
MNRPARKPAVFSKVSVKGQTVIPRQVCEKLGLHPGDTLRYRLTADGILIEKAPRGAADDPFVTFTEWSRDADEKAYANL